MHRASPGRAGGRAAGRHRAIRLGRPVAPQGVLKSRNVSAGLSIAPQPHVTVDAGAGHQAAIGREGHVVDRPAIGGLVDDHVLDQSPSSMESLAEEHRVAGQVPERDPAHHLAPEELRAIGREREAADPAPRLDRRRDRLDQSPDRTSKMETLGKSVLASAAAMSRPSGENAMSVMNAPRILRSTVPSCTRARGGRGGRGPGAFGSSPGLAASNPDAATATAIEHGAPPSPPSPGQVYDMRHAVDCSESCHQTANPRPRLKGRTRRPRTEARRVLSEHRGEARAMRRGARRAPYPTHPRLFDHTRLEIVALGEESENN